MIRRILKYFGYISQTEHDHKLNEMANPYNMGNMHTHVRIRKRGGNTTRTIDLAIQELFLRRTVTFHDHHPILENQHRILKIMLFRLQTEHGIRREGLHYNIDSKGIHITIDDSNRGLKKRIEDNGYRRVQR